MKVCLFLNHACNLRCSYCYNGHKFNRRMPMDVARAGIEMAVASTGGCSRMVHLSFFGGEPLMEIDLIRQLIPIARRRAEEAERTIRFQVVCNGTLLQGKTLDYLLENDVYLGVSIDGCRQAHDATRPFRNGRSSFDRVSRNLATLMKRDLKVGVKVIGVIDPLNVDYLGDSFDQLLELGVRNMSLNINYEGTWDEATRERFRAAIRNLGDRYIAAYRRGAAFTLNLFDTKIVTHLKGGYALTDRCDFGCEEVAIAPSGRLYPCDRLVGQDDQDEVVIGDVFSGVDPVRRDALITAKNDVLQGCGDCALLERCMHWCGCVNHAMTGSVGEVDGLLCWFEQRRIEEADRCASILFEEKNPGFLRRFYAPRMRTATPGTGPEGGEDETATT